MGELIRDPAGLMRAEPALPVHAVKTFQVASPARPASCEDVDCQAYANGWKTIVPDPSDHADLVRSLRGRYRFTESRQPGGLTEFTFAPGQPCFRASQHRLPWEGRERFFEHGGDWRGNPRGEAREHTRAADFVDSFANHQIRLAEAHERG